MQDENPDREPPQVVWPVKEATRQPAAETSPFGETRETPILLQPEVLLRHGARTLDPAIATQPGNDRRDRENGPAPDGDRGRKIRYQPTAYVSDEVLISVNPGRADDIAELATRLNAFLVPDDGPARAPSRVMPVAEDLDRARGRVPARGRTHARALRGPAFLDPGLGQPCGCTRRVEHGAGAA